MNLPKYLVKLNCGIEGLIDGESDIKARSYLSNCITEDWDIWIKFGIMFL
uniref:Uncharacterized protein n=1 Tax=Rhizophagus irregularis (strain DAOM 181602 / DAOM 197198 / MUCL 43194) TaxID=747089 RepID=U9TET6_RHIID